MPTPPPPARTDTHFSVSDVAQSRAEESPFTALALTRNKLSLRTPPPPPPPPPSPTHPRLPALSTTLNHDADRVKTLPCATGEGGGRRWTGREERGDVVGREADRETRSSQALLLASMREARARAEAASGARCPAARSNLWILALVRRLLGDARVLAQGHCLARQMRARGEQSTRALRRTLWVCGRDHIPDSPNPGSGSRESCTLRSLAAGPGSDAAGPRSPPAAAGPGHVCRPGTGTREHVSDRARARGLSVVVGKTGAGAVETHLHLEGCFRGVALRRLEDAAPLRHPLGRRSARHDGLAVPRRQVHARRGARSSAARPRGPLPHANSARLLEIRATKA